jgi:hypothetical protein
MRMASGTLKWGMTVAEAKAAFSGLCEPEHSELTSGAFEERLIQPGSYSARRAVFVLERCASQRVTAQSP